MTAQDEIVQTQYLRRIVLMLCFIAACVFSNGCVVPMEISGAKQPTPYTFKVTLADIEKAGSDDCKQDWVTGDAEADLAAAKALLKEYGVRVRYGKNPMASATAYRNTLWMRPDVDERPLPDQVRLYSHELVHYCDRKKDGDAAFDARYAHSAGRWVYETRAQAQSMRTLRIYGATDATVRQYIEQSLKSMPDRYWMHDIDPEQFLYETGTIWEEAAGLE